MYRTNNINWVLTECWKTAYPMSAVYASCLLFPVSWCP